MDEVFGVQAWAKDAFGLIELGDARRTARLVRMASSAAASPAGKVSAVFVNDAERQGAYDFLESEHVAPAALEQGVGAATAKACRDASAVFVAVDGSSLRFVDRTGGRGLGSIGTYEAGAVGIKVITALALGADGVPQGILRQITWRRPVERPARRGNASKRPVSKKETRHWLTAVTDSATRLSESAPRVRTTFLLDREGDSAAMLTTLAATGQGFVVRARWNREAILDDGRRMQLRSALSHSRSLGVFELAVTARAGRTARTARIDVSAKRVTLTLKNPTRGGVDTLTVTAVRAREIGTTPAGETPLEWTLLASAPTETLEQARAVVAAYALRWRIEEFHRTWKSGRCHVEDSQLRSVPALQKWAFILAAVAARIERLKLRARQHPDASALEEFSKYEVHATYLLKGHKPPKKTSTLAVVTRLVAELGGYTGKPSGGPAGAVTIARGLDKVRAAATVLRAMAELR